MWARGRYESMTRVASAAKSHPERLEYVAAARAPWVNTTPFGLPVVP